MHAVVTPCRRSTRSDSPAKTRRSRPTAAVVSPQPQPTPPPPPAASDDDYATVQRAGREFAREYFGRLNATGRAGSVADMFAERARFYAMDSRESRPSVGRADAVDALRRFCRAYGGRGGESHGCVTVLSVDARQDDYDETGAAAAGDGLRYELFVRAEWTTQDACTPVPHTPFVQTFSVRRRPRGPNRDHGPAADRLLEILSTTVKTTSAAAGASPPSVHDFVNSKDTQNNIYSSSKLQSSDKIISSHKKQLNVEDRLITVNNNNTTLSSRPSVTTLSSRQSATSTRFSNGGEKPPRIRWSFGINGRDSKSHKRFSRYKEFETYQKRVETFLKGTGDVQENNAPSARLCVDGLDTKITADDLYDAFGQFGTVLWVRIVTTNDDCGVQTALAGNRQPDNRTRCVRVGHVCFKQIEALTKAMNKQCQAGGCFIRGICMPVRRFVKFD